MPTLSPPARVLVTGANGYVGCWVVHILLDRGYSVRATIRSAEKARALSALMAKKHPTLDIVGALECVVVPDISAEGAFEEFLDGVQGVVHTATPVTFDLEDPEDYIRPALEGTMGILRSAAKRSDIKRVVVTSSIGAVGESIVAVEKTKIYTEEDWNESAVRLVREIGKDASGISKYNASKVLSEQAAWRYYRENKDALPYELSVIAPGWILGPLPDEPPSPSAFSTPSAKLEWEQLFATPPPPEPFPSFPFSYVDIRDVAEMHVRALEMEEAAGERFIACSHVCMWQDWFDAARSLEILPGLSKLHATTSRQKGAELRPHLVFSGEKARQKLGIVYKTVPETLKDLVEDFRSRGWLRHLDDL
ncbi:NAD-P-binding protein [Cubamyces lactineus]|nr:NAD-P-binding protein [Cubamyces lactineus]